MCQIINVIILSRPKQKWACFGYKPNSFVPRNSPCSLKLKKKKRKSPYTKQQLLSFSRKGRATKNTREIDRPYLQKKGSHYDSVLPSKMAYQQKKGTCLLTMTPTSPPRSSWPGWSGSGCWSCWTGAGGEGAASGELWGEDDVHDHVRHLLSSVFKHEKGRLITKKGFFRILVFVNSNQMLTALILIVQFC